MNDVSDPALLVLCGAAEMLVLLLLFASVVIWAAWEAFVYFRDRSKRAESNDLR